MSLHFSTVAALLVRASTSSSRVIQQATGLDDRELTSSRLEVDVGAINGGGPGGADAGAGEVESNTGGTLGRFSSEASVHSVVRRLESHDDVMLAQPLSTSSISEYTPDSKSKGGISSTNNRDNISSDVSPSLVHVEEEDDEVVTSLSASPSSEDLFKSRRNSQHKSTPGIPPLSAPPPLPPHPHQSLRGASSSSSSSSPLISSVSSSLSKLAYAFDPSSDTERSELVSVLVHLSDLSGQSRPEKQRLNWGARIVAEFRHQASKEKAQGLPVTPFMHALETPLQAARLQMTFVSNIVLPLFRAVQSCGLLVADNISEDGPIANLIHAEAHYRQVEVKEESANATAASTGTK
jgi:hypothetical protein